MEETGKEDDTKPAESGTTNKDQKNVERADPGLKKGYNEKNPSQPQGSFTPDSQEDDPGRKNKGDESE